MADLIDYDLRFPPHIAFITATEAECKAIVAAIEKYIQVNNPHLPSEVISRRVLFRLTWHPVTHGKKANPGAKRGRPATHASSWVKDNTNKSFHGLHTTSRASLYRHARVKEDQAAAELGAKWIALARSRNRSAPSRRRVEVDGSAYVV